MDPSEYRRTLKRAHYACGHSAEFRGAAAPKVGDWMVCITCGAETTVERMENGIRGPSQLAGEDEGRYVLRLACPS